MVEIHQLDRGGSFAEYICHFAQIDSKPTCQVYSVQCTYTQQNKTNRIESSRVEPSRSKMMY